MTWLMEAAYERRSTVPRAWHAYRGPADQDGPATAVCGATIRNAASAHREDTLVDLETSYRRQRWRRVCTACRRLAALE